jgi:hypothetical protein
VNDTRAQRNHRHEMSGAAAHRDLAEALYSCRATIAISGYGNPLVRLPGVTATADTESV